MPASLRAEDDTLVLKLGGSTDEFQHQLAAAKLIAGRRYNGADKTWEFPNDVETLLQIVHTVEPEMDRDLRERVKTAKVEVANELVTHLADDAALAVPWYGRLAPKQRSGIDFMAEHPHSLLADEMGSGKSVQAISTVYEYLIRNGTHQEFQGEVRAPGVFKSPKLIIAPNSVTGHWSKELEKWAGVPSAIVSGSVKNRNALVAEFLNGGLGEWLIVNWEKLRLMPELAKIPWSAIIADEAHRAKNRKAKQTKALWKLHAPIQLALTGTPIMNDPGELWALLKWLLPEQYTSYWAFFTNYAESYAGYKGKAVVIGVKNADSLRFELADKMVRRTKREIHGDIPEPFDPVINTITMPAAQAKLYDEVTKQFWVDLRQDVEDEKITLDLAALAEAVENEDLDGVKMMIPNSGARFTRQRQVATSGALIGAEDVSGKLDELTLKVLEYQPRPFVIFAWYRMTLELLQRRFDEAGVQFRYFHGDNSTAAERQVMATEFQEEKFPVIGATIRSGGVGIDLFRASDVELAESDTVPANNQQAIDRADRKGQTERVQATFWRSQDTVETGNIASKLATKTLIVNTILGEGK